MLVSIARQCFSVSIMSLVALVAVVGSANKTGQQAELSIFELQPARAFESYIFVLDLPWLSCNICAAVYKAFLFPVLLNIYMIFVVKYWMSFIYLCCPERQLYCMTKGEKAIQKTLLWIKIKMVLYDSVTILTSFFLYITHCIVIVHGKFMSIYLNPFLHST